MSTLARVAATWLLGGFAVPARTGEKPADTVLLGGRILLLDAKEQICQALAIRDRHVVTAGTDRQIRRYVGKETRGIRLARKTVVPGLIESHVHSFGVAREEAYQPYVELPAIAAIQAWIRKRAAQLPAGEWVRVPRNDVTRIRERRHPTPAELDAACSTHPVIFTAVRA